MKSNEIKIYGKIYKVKPVSSSVGMQQVAELVDTKMKELSGVKGKASTVDVAVLTALNLGHELMEMKQGNKGDDSNMNERLDGMIQKLCEALGAIENKGISSR